MEELKSLPKEFIQLLFLKMVFAIIGIITIGGLFVLVTVSILYCYHYDIWVLTAGGILAWTLFLIILATFVYFKENAFRQKTKIIISFIKKPEAWISAGVLVYKTISRKLHKK